MAQEKPDQSKEPAKEAPAKLAKSEENVVFVGQKPVMNYVVACLTFFSTGGREICIKARGRAISKAVDTFEVLRRSFLKDVAIKGIKLGTEEIMREPGQKANVSTIEITVAKAERK